MTKNSFVAEVTFKDELRKWVSDDNDVIPEFLDMIALKYGIDCENTMSGACGKTAKFWMICCHLVDLYLLFHGATKTYDVDLFTYVLHDNVNNNENNVDQWGIISSAI